MTSTKRVFEPSGLFCLSSKEDFSNLNLSNLSGIGITDDEIILGETGWQEYLNSHLEPDIFNLRDGRFVVLHRHENKIFIRSDPSGTELLFLYLDGPGKWAISNSFYHLAITVSKFGWQLDVNEAACASMFINASFGRQPISKQTAFDQIILVPLSTYIAIDLDSKTIGLQKESVSKSIVRYEDGLLSWFKKWKSIIRSLTEKVDHPNSIILNLSGGVDTRGVLSLFLGDEVKRARIYSRPHQSNDLAIARSLGQVFGFSVSTERPDWGRLPLNIQYMLYKLGNTGIFNLPTPPPLHTMPSDTFKFSGVLSENLRPFYSGYPKDWRRKISALLPEALNSLAPDVQELLTSSFNDYDIDEEDPVGMVKHYRELRSRIIGGRNWFNTLKYRIVTPFGDPLLLDIYNGLDSTSIRDRRILLDIILLGGGEKLACHPYDDEFKSFDSELMRSSAFWNKGQPYFMSGNCLKSYKVYGEFSAPGRKELEGASGHLFSEIEKRVGHDQQDSTIKESLPTPLRSLLKDESLYPGGGRKRKIEIITWHSIFNIVRLSSRSEQ